MVGKHETWRKVVPKKLWENFDFENFRSEWFSIHTSERRAPASELVLLRGGLASKIELQGGSLESKILYRGVGAEFEKPKIYFRLTMTGKHETWRIVVYKKLWKNCDSENFWSESFSIRTSKGRAPASELVLLRGGLPSAIALQGGKPRVQNFVTRGRCKFEKPKIYFRQQGPDNPPPPCTPAVNATYVVWRKSKSYYEQ